MFVIVDLSQIEARIGAWYGGESGLLDAFKAGRCVYSEFGKHLFGHVLNPEKEKSERSIAKQAVLGLQFGMGVDRFLKTLSSQCSAALASAMKTLGLCDEKEFASMVVKAYRTAYPQLALLPKLAGDAYTKAVTAGVSESMLTVGFQGQFTIEYCRNSCVLLVHLPTGGRIHYREIDATLRPSRFPNGRQECVLTYAGISGRREISYSIPFENVVQATARDILGFHLLRAEKEGLVIRMHAHDEAVFEVPKNRALAALDTIKAIFSEMPASCPGLPLACKGFLSDRYTKDEKHMQFITRQYAA